MLRSKIDQTNAKITQLMNSALKVQKKQLEDHKHDEILDVSPQRPIPAPANDFCPDKIKELADNFSTLLNCDLSGMGNATNMQHLLKATNHLKIAFAEFNLATQKKEEANQHIYNPEILRLNQQHAQSGYGQTMY